MSEPELNISNLLVLVSYIALLSMNAIDAAMTRKALNKSGFEEKMAFTRRAIKELGLNGAMFTKSLLPVPFAILVLMCWNDTFFSYSVSLVFAIPTIWLTYVVYRDCIELGRGNQSKK